MATSPNHSQSHQPPASAGPSLIDYNLSLNPEERALNHQRALETINELIKAREQIYGKPKPSPQTSS